MLQLSDREWAEFRVGELFRITQGRKWITKSDIENNPGKTPLISCSGTNNGIMGSVDPSGINKCTVVNNVLTVAVSGSAGATFYQGIEAVINSGVLILDGIEFSDKETYLFICALVREVNSKFNYGLKASADRVGNQIINLPITPDGLPDYQFMHDYIAEREPDYSWATQCIEPNAELSLTDREWAEFKVGDLFTFTRGKRITKKFADENPGIIPVIAGGESNNGILCYLSEECKNCRVIKDGCISVAAFGTAGCVHYHNYKCFIDDKAIALNIKDNRFDKNKYVNIFMVCTLSKLSDRYSYGRGVTVDRYSDEVISLPITQDGTPDYDFMAQYIKSLPFSKVLEA